MLHTLRRFCLLLLAAGLALAGGCSGTSYNSSYFPGLGAGGGPADSHGVAGILGGNDPPAVRLEVVPADTTNPVRTQQVLVATVYDAGGQPLRGRRIEWMLEGVGNIIEVDDSGGTFANRAAKVNNQYAVGYTASVERRVSRNNGNPNDDFTVGPGQTWCVVSSAVEGDSHVTAYAPDIANWDAHKVFVTSHWVDADWIFPKPAVNRAGTPCTFTTGVFRHSDHQPLANYRVRYRLLDGPPAAFAPGQGQEALAVTDLKGEAAATLAQVAPVMGVNRVGVEIIRQPDPSLPSGTALVVGHTETTVEWQAAQVVLTNQGPPTAAIGGELVYTITITNNGKVASQFLTVHDPIPQGLECVRSEPPASKEGTTELIWPVKELPPGESRTFQVVFKAPGQPGRVTNTATVINRDGVKDEKSAATDVVAAQLQVRMTGPEVGAVGAPVTYAIAVSNPGTGPAANVILRDSFDAGLEHESKANPVELTVGTLAPGASKQVRLTLTPRKTGKLVNRLEATADGGLKGSAEHPITVQEAKLSVKQTGPAARYVGRPAVWSITVRNPGPMPVANVTVRDTLPAEVTFQSASDGGQVVGGQVVWNLGALQPGDQRVVQVSTKCMKLAPQAVNVVLVTADPGVKTEEEARLEIRGLPAFHMDLSALDNPVEVNGKTTYKMAVTNQGTLPGRQVEITATVPSQMKVLSANGPTKPKIDGRTVTYPALDSLAPQETVTYTVEVQALQAGDARFRAELRSSMLSAPVIKEESTNIYAAPAGAATSSPKPAAATPPAPSAPPPSPKRPVTPMATPAAPAPSLPPPSAPAAPPPAPASPVGPPAPAPKPTPPPVVPTPAAPAPAATPRPPAPAPPPPATATSLPPPALPSPALPPPSPPAGAAPALPSLSDPLPPPPPLPSPGGAGTK